MSLNDQQFMRYSRHLLMDDIGEAGQLKLLNAHVLIVGLVEQAELMIDKFLKM